MAHYLFNFSEGDQEQATALIRAKMWGIGGDEKHRNALAPADLVLIYLAPPKQEFISQAELASAVHDWTSAEAEVCPGDSPCGVLLSHVEEWDPPVAMNTVLPRIDPEASNPYGPMPFSLFWSCCGAGHDGVGQADRCGAVVPDVLVTGFLDAVEVVPAAFDHAGAGTVPAPGAEVLCLRNVGLDLCQDGPGVLRGKRPGQRPGGAGYGRSA
jgi:hypothetical protein